MLDKVISAFNSSWLIKATPYVNNPQKAKALAEEASTFMGKGKLKEVASNLGSIIGYVRDVATGRYKGYSVGKLALAIATLIYIVNPLDVIPDITPIIGFADDAALVAWTFSQLQEELAAYRRWRG